MSSLASYYDHPKMQYNKKWRLKELYKMFGCCVHALNPEVLVCTMEFETTFQIVEWMHFII